MTKPDAPPEAPPVAEPPPVEAAPSDPLADLVRGRVVLYVPMPYEARNSDAGPWPAIVTHVGTAYGEVTLCVFLPVPTSIGNDPVTRRNAVPYSADGAPGSWRWMFEGQGERYTPDRP